MDTDLLHFDYLGAEIIEFDIGMSNFKNIGKWQFFGGGQYLNFK